MPSQEDYLDSLLKDLDSKSDVQTADESVREEQAPYFDALDEMSEEEIEKLLSGADVEEAAEEFAEAETGEEAGYGSRRDMEQAPYLDAVSEMSEEEIERILSGADVEEAVEEKTAEAEAAEAEAGRAENEEAVSSGEDLLHMLEGTEDEELQDIQDMLRKSDNNEALELLSDDSESGRSEDSYAEQLELLGTAGDDKKRKAMERKRQKEEKAAAKKAAREAARAEKAAKKESAAKAKRERKRKDTQENPVQNPEAEELDFDREELDKLVSQAGMIGKEAAGAEETASEGLTSAGLEAGGPASENLADEELPGQETKEAGPETAGDGFLDMGGGDLGLDLNSLFGSGEETDFTDFAALDADSTDAVLPESMDSGEAKKGKGKEKKGFLAKILAFLLEDDYEDEEENESIRLSEENQGILDDLDKEDKGIKGIKGGKGKKGRKQEEKSKKEPKPKKAPKLKKERPPKEPEPYIPGKKLSLKKVLPIVLLGATVGTVIFIFVNISTDYADKRVAQDAYYAGDYETCYQNLFGKELNETEAVMYGKSESILYIRLWYREYEMFVEEGSETEALDSLIQTVKDYPMLYEYAAKWNATEEIYPIYADILNILLNKYGVTELQAMEIAKVRDDVEYTRMVVALAQGKGYGSWNEPEMPDAPLPDELPEEAEIGGGNFVENR